MVGLNDKKKEKKKQDLAVSSKASDNSANRAGFFFPSLKLKFKL